VTAGALELDAASAWRNSGCDAEEACGTIPDDALVAIWMGSSRHAMQCAEIAESARGVMTIRTDARCRRRLQPVFLW
jgi:hypothetical protein